AGELPYSEFIIDANPRVDFLPRIPIYLKAVSGFEKFDLRGIFFGFSRLGSFDLLFFRFALLGRYLPVAQENRNGREEYGNRTVQHAMDRTACEVHMSLNRSVGNT